MPLLLLRLRRSAAGYVGRPAASRDCTHVNSISGILQLVYRNAVADPPGAGSRLLSSRWLPPLCSPPTQPAGGVETTLPVIKRPKHSGGTIPAGGGEHDRMFHRRASSPVLGMEQRRPTLAGSLICGNGRSAIVMFPDSSNVFLARNIRWLISNIFESRKTYQVHRE